MSLLWQLILNGLIISAVYSLSALGLSLVYNTSKVFHVAHAGFFTVSVYLFYVFYKVLNFNFFVSLLLCFVSISLLAMFVEQVLYYPLYKRRASNGIKLIVSLGIYIIMVNIIALIFGNEVKVLYSGIEKSYSFLGLVITRIQIFQFIFGLTFSLGTILFLRFSVLGKAIRAVKENPQLAEVVGVDIRLVRFVVLVMGSLLVGICSILVGFDVGFDPWGGMSVFLFSAVAMIVGGIDSFEGSILGSFLLGVLKSVVLWKVSSRWGDTVVFIVLIIFLLFRPWGIVGSKKRLEEMV